MKKGEIEQISDVIMDKLKSFIGTMLEPIISDIAEMKSDLAEIKGDIARMKSNIQELSTRLTAAENEIQHTKNSLTKLQNANNKHEQHYRGTCLKIYGLDVPKEIETIPDHCQFVYTSLIKPIIENDQLLNLSNKTWHDIIDYAHQVPTKNGFFITVRFTSKRYVDIVNKFKGKYLRNKKEKIFINPSLTKLNEQKLFHVRKHSSVLRCWFARDIKFVTKANPGRVYQLRDLEDTVERAICRIDKRFADQVPQKSNSRQTNTPTMQPQPKQQTYANVPNNSK